MLKPQTSPTRELVNLDGLWRFALDPGTSHEPWRRPLDTPLEAAVPASYNDLFADAAIRDHVGWVWYQRTVRVPRGWAGERVFVRVDAATHEGVVYVDDAKVAEHVGGYTPFEADITDAGRPPAQEFRLTVGVNNELTNMTIPPGSITVADDGGRKQEYLHDFYNYAGLARSVWLYSAPAVRVDRHHGHDRRRRLDRGRRLSTSRPRGADAVRVTRARRRRAPRSAAADGVAGDAARRRREALAAGRRLPLHADGGGLVDGEVVDSTRCRSASAPSRCAAPSSSSTASRSTSPASASTRTRAVRGKGHDNAYLVHDFQLMDWIGANSFRTSHYPYAEEVMEFADRHGIVVIDETAPSGSTSAIGGGIFGGQTKLDLLARDHQRRHAGHARPGDPRAHRPRQEPPERGHVVDHQRAGLERGGRARVLRAARGPHPRARPDPPGDLRRTSCSRPTRHDLIADLFDVICLNRYYGWYVDTGDLAAAEQQARGRAARLAAEVRQARSS